MDATPPPRGGGGVHDDRDDMDVSADRMRRVHIHELEHDERMDCGDAVRNLMSLLAGDVNGDDDDGEPPCTRTSYLMNATNTTPPCL